MSTEQIALAVFAGIGAIWAVFKLVLPRFVDAKIKSDEYERARSAFREDKAFEMLEDTLSHWKLSYAAERDASASARKMQVDLIETVARLIDTVCELSNNLDRQTDIIKVLTEQVRIFNVRLDDIEDAAEDEIKRRILTEGKDDIEKIQNK